MTIMEALDKMDELIDESDPDVSCDFTDIDHYMILLILIIILLYRLISLTPFTHIKQLKEYVKHILIKTGSIWLDSFMI